MRNSFAPDSDGDFGPTNIVRTVGRDSLRTMTLETRLDSEWTDQISTLVGLFYSNEATRENVTDTISLVHPVLGPISLVRHTVAKKVADTYAASGTMFWKPNSDWEAVSAQIGRLHV